jgi:hypothetical protein
MSALEWLKQMDWAAVGEVLGVAVVGFLSALGGGRAVVKRVGTLLKKALGPDLIKALVSEVAVALKPAVLRTLGAAIAQDGERRQAETDKVLVSAVRASLAEGVAELREQLPSMVREVLREELHTLNERVDHLDRRLAYLEGRLNVPAVAK